MGTSKGYLPPTNGGWPQLKKIVNDFSSKKTGKISPENVLKKYFDTLGGSEGVLNSESMRRTTTNISNFFGVAFEKGFDEALDQFKFHDLAGLPPQLLISGLVDKLCGPGSTLDEVLIRLAMFEMTEDLFDECETVEDMDEVLHTGIENGIEEIMANFFGYYIYERFCRDFYEILVGKIGPESTQNSLNEIKDCIFAMVQAFLVAKNVEKTNWSGSEGRQLVDSVIGGVIKIYEVE